MKHYNLLVFPGGTEIGLEIHRALRFCKEITLFSAGMDIPNHAPFVFKRHYVLPSIHEPMWIEELNHVCDRHRIDFIYPAYDDVIVALAKNSDQILTRVVSSPLQTCLITRSKSSTYHLFQGILPVPTVYEEPHSVCEFPVFVKPDKGQGSEKTYLVSNRQELEVALSKDETAIVLEYLPGDEFTVDCFSDREKGLLFCGGRRRVRTKSGISMASTPFKDDRFAEFARAISANLRIYGAWFFQLKKDRNNNYKLLEIAPRIAGTMALHRVMGINFPLLSIYEQDRVPITIITNRNSEVEIERAVTNRYRHSISYDTVYIDLDDTLILNGKVNTEIVRFIFQCINQNISVKLLTKHEKDVAETLGRFRLSGLFDDVVHLKREEQKSLYIEKPTSILIDDSFSERKDVHEKCGIPTFDSSMIELLFDERL
jgi:hypothetical protein